ncbi:DUF3825 domain-containing protein [Corallococcus sp. CA049B]|uniref:DUF3825 domain-containing protein n=1 Tax=Corallococcus sp. CA049B TaxID=2316730 RepID=UPI000EA13DF9|nr:DUF3825 domain-containing protein [Corallococcus sp. CA049B]RKG82784.1 DUF3825 domain-containing protein [Corallococcus sp. CA049B]
MPHANNTAPEELQSVPPPLRRFAYLPSFTDRLADLEQLAEPEDWNYQHTESPYPRPILYSYVLHTFNRIEEEGKIAYSDDNQYACFNTGLATVNQEPIYALFQANKVPGKQLWCHQGFVRGGEQRLTRFAKLPTMAHYFTDPSELIFDMRLELRVNYEHMLTDNRARFPKSLNTSSDYHLQTLLNTT